jgi:hypothetical protein
MTETITPSESEVPTRPNATTTSQPTKTPTAKGHAVDANPAALIPWSWTDRPMATKTKTTSRSMAAQSRYTSPKASDAWGRTA